MLNGANLSAADLPSLLVLIFSLFKIVHYFRQQFKYHSSFGFARRGIAQSAVEHDVLVQQEPVHLLLPNFLDCQTTRLKSYPNRSTIRRYNVKGFRRYPEAADYYWHPATLAALAERHLTSRNRAIFEAHEIAPLRGAERPSARQHFRETGS